MSDRNLPPDVDPEEAKALLEKWLMPWQAAASKASAGVFRDLHEQIDRAPIGGHLKTKLMANLMVCRGGAAGFFASALTILSVAHEAGFDVHQLATAFAKGLNIEVGDIAAQQREHGLETCTDPTHHHERNPKVEITLTVRVVDPPPPPEENA